MINYLFTILLLTQCLIIHSHTVDNTKEICVEDYIRPVFTNHLRICYINDVQNRSILVWFTIGKSVNDTFDSYRFILRSFDYSLSSSIIIGILTNFTELIDFNNSLRMFHLDSGLYEVCIEFQSNSTTFIYQPRDGCIPIQIGKVSHGTFEQSSTALLISLATSIVLFFILGLVVQWGKVRRNKKYQEDKQQSRLSNKLPTISFKQQRERVIRKLFRRQMDEARPSRMRQWARSQAFRHRISTQEQDIDEPISFRRWSNLIFTSVDQSPQSRSRTETISQDRNPPSASSLNTNNIYTIPEKEHYQIPSKNTSADLMPLNEFIGFKL